MKLNIAYPGTGCQKLFEVVDEHKIRIFYDKRIGAEVPADSLGDEWKGYVLRITGGNDKQGFPMMQGVLTTARVRLLLNKDHSCYRPKKKGERKRKSVRGCIVDGNLSVIAMIIVRRGEQEIPGLTDKTVPRPLGPKRASKIRKLFNLTYKDDVTKYVIKRPIPPKAGEKEDEKKKMRYKSPKIQRLITPKVIQRRKRLVRLRDRAKSKNAKAAGVYAGLLKQRSKAFKAKKEELKRKRRESQQSAASAASE